MIRIPKTIYNQMLAHAAADAPNECCGILSGRNDIVELIYPMTNTDHSPVRYMMEPKEQFKAFKDMRTRELDLLAIYHSHPHTEAYPSTTDVHLAYYPDSVYIILSLQDANRPVAKGFRIVDEKITDEELEIMNP